MCFALLFAIELLDTGVFELHGKLVIPAEKLRQKGIIVNFIRLMRVFWFGVDWVGRVFVGKNFNDKTTLFDYADTQPVAVYNLIYI